MTAFDREMRKPCCDEVIAGEYVLGMLSADECRKVEARLRRDGQFAAMVGRWQENLATSDDDAALHLPPGMRAPIGQDLLVDTPCDAVFSGRVSGGCWHSLTLWRAFAFASFAVAAGLALSLSALLAPRPVSGGRLVADLSGGNAAVGLLARYDDASGALEVTPVAAGGKKGGSLEFWLSETGKPPVSLGILPQTGEGRFAVPPDVRGRLAEGATISVSLEPSGGSPTGGMTGPVLATGAARFD